MFYAYTWLREDGTPYYAGKGKDNRAFRDHWVGRKVVHKPPPRKRIIIYPCNTEAESTETEIALIWYYGRKDLGTGVLRNLTDGGEGAAGLSSTTVAKIAKSKRGHAVPQAVRDKISKKLQGRPGRKHSEETKAKIRAYRKSLYKSEEERKKVGLRAKSRPKKTQCLRGHLRTLDNLYNRGCKQCMSDSLRIRRAAAKK